MKKTLIIVSILLFGLQNTSNAKIYKHKSCNYYFFSNFSEIDRNIRNETESIKQEINSLQEEFIQLFNARQKAFSKKNKKRDNRKKVVYKIKIYSQNKKPKIATEDVFKNTDDKKIEISQNAEPVKNVQKEESNIQNKTNTLEDDLLIDTK